jgi:dipeptidyl aminopeptidase/acylaminoacyl peptidase
MRGLLLVLVLVVRPGLTLADDDAPQPRRPFGGPSGVYKDRITPHWFADDTRFWYRNDLRGGTKEFVLVDAEKGTRGPAFDHAKLAASLSKAAGQEYRADRLPFTDITFVKDAKAVRFEAVGKTWMCDLGTYECTTTTAEKKKDPAEAPAPQTEDDSDPDAVAPFLAQQPDPRRRPFDRDREVTSPDGKWVAFVRDHNVCVRPKGGGDAVQLGKAGVEGNAFGMLSWSPDGKAVVGFRVEPAETREVHLIESSPAGGGRAKLSSRPYALPGDRLTAYEPWVFDPQAKTAKKVETDRIDFGRPRPRWNKDGRHFTYEHVGRGHQRFRLVEVDAHTGTTRNLIDEKSDTFIWTVHFENVGLPSVWWLEKTDEVIYPSEKDGWRHLYLIDVKTGAIRNPITTGEWVVRGIDRVDEAKRQVWFRASGKEPDQDPYFVHHYRVNFDGTGLVALTAGNGTHTVQFSPTRKYLIDTSSRVDAAPVHELRRSEDGKQMVKLEEADISGLKATGWAPPEVFVAKGRDGKTDIWGIICRPRGFDPAKTYPVIEQIYAGPQGSFVPKAFSSARRFSNLTDLGFVVVQMDGMGTANRSKAFHDVCWKNLKDAGFPDRILWHKAVAAKYPWYDITRVGIYGGSAGGQNATAAVLFHGDFYTAAVSGCGCHDNRMDKASWNEQWMGYPVGPQYAACSNIDNAHRLRGKLLLIVGEMDTNVPPESTYRLCDALIKAGKDFDFVLVPGAGHGMGGAYGQRRLQDFFVRHLLGTEPPERNAPARKAELPEGGPLAERAVAEAGPKVTGPPESFFARFPDRDREAARKFYTKHLDVRGLSVAAAGVVDDAALVRTHDIVTHILAGRPDILDTMAKAGTRLIIIGKDQVYTDMPEYRNSPNPAYLNERVRGTGGLGVTSFGEENLLNLPLDRYDDESIGVHEFCHTIDAALRRLDPAWRERLNRTYRGATDQGLWRNTYAASNPAEYWAEIAQSYFDCNRVNNWNHGPVGTREQLKEYDPEGYELVRTTFNLKPADDWRYTPLRSQPSVIPPPAELKCDPYYTKFTLAREFPVIGSDRVSDEALLRANDTVRKMFAYRHDILKALINDGARLVVLGRAEKLSDLPELKGAAAKAGFDGARYLDYSADRKLMVVPEENVLGLPGDPFPGRCAVVAAFARGLYTVTASRPVDPEFDRRRDKQQYELRVKRLDVEFGERVKGLHEAAVKQDLWKGTTAARGRADYWAAGVEAYFDASGTGPAPTGADHPVATREALRQYDPGLFQIVEETMAYKGHPDWRVKR